MQDYEPSSEVPEQYRLSTERLRDIVHGDDDDDDDDYEDIEGYSESGFRLVYKDNLVAALQKAPQTGKCKGRIIVVEDSDNIRGDLMDVWSYLVSFVHFLTSFSTVSLLLKNLTLLMTVRT